MIVKKCDQCGKIIDNTNHALTFYRDDYSCPIEVKKGGSHVGEIELFKVDFCSVDCIKKYISNELDNIFKK